METLPAWRCSLARHFGWTGTLHKFRKAQLKNDQIIINDYFARLGEYRHQLASSAEAISEEELHAHIYTSTRHQFEITVKILKRQTHPVGYGCDR